MTQIKGHKEYYITRKGEVYSMINNAGNTRKNPYLLKQTLDKEGYYWVGLKGSNKKMRKIHRLVAVTFIDNWRFPNYPSVKMNCSFSQQCYNKITISTVNE